MKLCTGYKLDGTLAAETLNGEGPTVDTENMKATDFDRQFSARQVIDDYEDNDMPLGWFLPNDGYGAGYGQNGYYKTGGVNSDGASSADRLNAVRANVDNLKKFTEYANSKGVSTGLWTQSNLEPDSNPETPWHLLRDFDAEVVHGLDLCGKGCGDFSVDAVILPAHQGLAGEFQENSVVLWRHKNKV